MRRVEFIWRADPDCDIKIPCDKCGAPMDALVVEPYRSLSYLNWIWLCSGEGCRRFLPRMDARSTARREATLARPEGATP